MRVLSKHVGQKLCDASDQFSFLRGSRLLSRDSDVDEWHCLLLCVVGIGQSHAAWVSGVAGGPLPDLESFTISDGWL